MKISYVDYAIVIDTHPGSVHISYVGFNAVGKPVRILGKPVILRERNIYMNIATGEYNTDVESSKEVIIQRIKCMYNKLPTMRTIRYPEDFEE